MTDIELEKMNRKNLQQNALETNEVNEKYYNLKEPHLLYIHFNTQCSSTNFYAHKVSVRNTTKKIMQF